MADDILLGKVHRLSDLELAVLLCLICREHCIISTESHAIDQLVQELQLATTRTFSLKPVVIDCGPLTTLDDFAAGIQLSSSPSAPRPSSPYRRSQSHLHHNPQASLGHASFHSAHTGRIPSLTPVHTGGNATRASGGSQVLSSSPQWPQTPLPGSGEIAHVVLAKNLDLAPKAVQIQALELLRTKRLFTRTSVLVAPKQFLLIAVLSAPSGGQAHLTPHLNDFFYVAHWHDPEDGFANIEEAEEEEEATWKGKGSTLSGYAKSYEESDAETSSTTSVVKTYNTKRGSLSSSTSPAFSESDLSTLAKLSQEVSVDIEVIRYQMNIVSFLRMHHAVAGGISPAATKHFDQLIRCLAPLHGIDFVTPSLVALAAKKIYLHRIQIVAPEKERSMQWGSELEAVAALLEDIGPEDVIEDVLGMVSAPL